MLMTEQDQPSFYRRNLASEIFESLLVKPIIVCSFPFWHGPGSKGFQRYWAVTDCKKIV